MTRKFESISILEMREELGEERLKYRLSQFSCPLNPQMEQFVKENAIDFAKRKMSITYLVINESGDLAAIFTLAHKAIELKESVLSNTRCRKMSRYALLNSETKSYITSAFMIAQFGKNFAVPQENMITGNELMDMAMEILRKIQREIGGGIVFLECEDNPKLLDFYQNSSNHFLPFDKRFSVSDQMKYVQLYQFF